MNALMIFACATCGAGNDPTRPSYIWMSVIISLLPLALLGGIIAWVSIESRRRRMEELEGSGEVTTPTKTTFAEVERVQVRGEPVSTSLLRDRG